MTDQTLKKEQLATQGWLVHPQVNRLAGFDGALLHGVVPGRGVPMMLSGSDEQEQQEGSTSTSSSQQTGAPRRITFMAAFWRGPMSTKPRADRMPGSSQPIRKCWLAFYYHHCVDMPPPPPRSLSRMVLLVAASSETIRERGYTWPALFTAPRGSEDRAEGRLGARSPSEAPAVPVSRVWARVDGEESEDDEDGSAPIPHYEKCFQGF